MTTQATPASLTNHLVQVVDDDDSFRTGLVRVLNASGYMAVGYRCAGEFLMSGATSSPGCLVLDVSMPGPSGIELLDALLARELAPPVVFVTGCTEVPVSVHAMKAGAVDFLSKPVRTEALLQAVRLAIEIDDRRRAAQQEADDLRARYESLSARERAVFTRVVQGFINKQIALELDACERTVKSHRARMMEKLQVTSLAGLIRVARALEPGEIELAS